MPHTRYHLHPSLHPGGGGTAATCTHWQLRHLPPKPGNPTLPPSVAPPLLTTPIGSLRRASDRRVRWRHRAPARWPGLELWIAAACRPSSDVFGGRECQAEGQSRSVRAGRLEKAGQQSGSAWEERTPGRRDWRHYQDWNGAAAALRAKGRSSSICGRLMPGAALRRGKE